MPALNAAQDDISICCISHHHGEKLVITVVCTATGESSRTRTRRGETHVVSEIYGVREPPEVPEHRSFRGFSVSFRLLRVIRRCRLCIRHVKQGSIRPLEIRARRLYPIRRESLSKTAKHCELRKIGHRCPRTAGHIAKPSRPDRGRTLPYLSSLR